MHERTPKLLAPFAETHRQVGAICHASVGLEHQLEIAISELGGTEDDLSPTQGRHASALIDMAKALLRDGVVADPLVADDLRGLLHRIKLAMNLRDQVVHSIWLRPTGTPADHVIGLRFRRREEQRRAWHTDELEQLREDLAQLTNELSTKAYNAVRPPEEHIG